MTTGDAMLLATCLVGAWLLGYAVVALVTRPAAVRPAPATPDLGGESPAVVNLLVNRWRLTADAAEATLLDLATRGCVELQQAGADPVDTAIQLRAGDSGELLPYERYVLDRVRRLAMAGVVPVTALAFRDRDRARSWNTQLRDLVVADARRRGLSRRRISPAVAAALVATAGAAAIGPAAVGWTIDGLKMAFASGGLTFMALCGLAAWSMGERDTPAGRTAAQRWLGVREWLRGHPEFANLPPAAVTVWDRYLPYGAALGATRTTSAVLDLGIGDRRRVWSAYGGQWRRVRVRYPRLRPHSGAPARWLVALALVVLLSGGLGLSLGAAAIGSGDPAGGWRTLAAGLLALAYGGYVLVRAVHERAHLRILTGEVLWVRPWRRRWYDQSRAEPWLHYLAVDEGTGDRTTAWGLPSIWADRVVEGDTVEVTVRPWSRRVTSVTVLRRGPRRPGGRYTGSGPGRNRVVRQQPRGFHLLENPRTPEP